VEGDNPLLLLHKVDRLWTEGKVAWLAR